MNNPFERRYDLDSIRVIAFGLLILYHVGMLYVDWGWHIESQYSSEALRYLMFLVNQWRLPLLFFISGSACYYACLKYDLAQFTTLRLQRLIFPILLGILVLAPAQLFYEMIFQGAIPSTETSYLNFWAEYLNKDSALFAGFETVLFGHMRWYHLWFVVYLLFYSLAFIALKALPFSTLSNKLATNIFAHNYRVRWWFMPPLILAIFGVLMRDSFPRSWAFYNDWYVNATSFTLFIFGYWVANNDYFWQQVKHQRQRLLLAAFSLYLVIVYLTSLPEDTPLPDWVEQIADVFIEYLVQLNSWTWILVVCGYASHHLNQKNRMFAYLNSAVFPLFIVHQPIILISAFYLINLNLNPLFESLSVIFITVSGSLLCYEVIRRFNLLRLLFGLKPNSKAQPVTIDKADLAN